MINILHISSPITWRGGERQIANLTLSLRDKNMNQYLLCPANTPLADFCIENKLEVFTLNKGNGFSLKWANTINRICIEKNISFIHVHDSKSHTYAIIAAVLFKKTPKIIVSRRVIFPIKKKWLTRYKYTHPKVDTIVCISKAVEKVILSSFPAANTLVIPSCIAIDKYENIHLSNSLRTKYTISDDFKLIGYVAALSKEKDHNTFIETARLIIQKNKKVVFFIIGEGKQKPIIEELIKKNELQNKIILTGFIKEIDSIIPQLDILLFTSTSEGLGSSILDFFLAKIPVVSTRCGGVEEIITHNKTGLLSPIGDPSELSKNVLLLLKNSVLKDRIIKNAYEYVVNKHSLQQLGNKTFNIYQKTNNQLTTSSDETKKITAIIPTFNEETDIEKAIKSVLWCDEIIIIDSFSTDNTLQIAQKYDVKIIQREYNYSANQKNWIIPQAKNEWIFLLDADEILSDKLHQEIVKVLKNDKDKFSGYWIKRDNFFMDKRIRFGTWKNDRVIRLFKRDECRYEDKKVHAEIIQNQNFGILKNHLQHYTYKNLDDFIDRQKRYSRWKAIDKASSIKHITFYHILLRPFINFFISYVIKLGFLDGKQGFIISTIDAYNIFLRHLYIWRAKNGEKTI